MDKWDLLSSKNYNNRSTVTLLYVWSILYILLYILLYVCMNECIYIYIYTILYEVKWKETKVKLKDRVFSLF